MVTSSHDSSNIHGTSAPVSAAKEPEKTSPTTSKTEELAKEALTQSASSTLPVEPDRFEVLSDGLAQTVAGVSEMIAGGVLVSAAVGTAGLSVPFGWIVILHGANVTSAGVTTLVTGKHQDSLTCQGMEALGASLELARAVDSCATLVFTFGAEAVASRAIVFSAELLSLKGGLNLKKLSSCNQKLKNFSIVIALVAGQGEIISRLAIGVACEALKNLSLQKTLRKVAKAASVYILRKKP